MRENQKIRKAARMAGVPLWKIAATAGISEPTLMRWLRFPLSAEKEKLLMDAIAVLEQEVN